MNNCIDSDCLANGIMDLSIPTILLRAKQGQYNKGRWEYQGTDEICINAVIQNATPKDMQDLPEGRRIEETVKIYTTEKLYSKVDQDQYPVVEQKQNQRQPDKIVWHNSIFEIHSVEDRSQYGKYYKSIGIKVIQ